MRTLRYGLALALVAGVIATGPVASADHFPYNGWTRVTNPNCPAVSCSIDDGSTLVAHATEVATYPLHNGYDNVYTLYLGVEPWCYLNDANIVLSMGNTPDPATGHMPAVGTDISGDGKPDASGTVPRGTRGEFDVCFNNGTLVTGFGTSTYPVIINVT